LAITNQPCSAVSLR